MSMPSELSSLCRSKIPQFAVRRRVDRVLILADVQGGGARPAGMTG
jgi:hypothetical protein